MTKMDMVWVAVASLIHPRTGANVTITKSQIDDEVLSLFGETITPVMINSHLVNSVDRQANRINPQRGGSRNRYLTRTEEGFRLYKDSDASTDGWEKTGPTHPFAAKTDSQYTYLVDWFGQIYFNS